MLVLMALAAGVAVLVAGSGRHHRPHARGTSASRPALIAVGTPKRLAVPSHGLAPRRLGAERAALHRFLEHGLPIYCGGRRRREVALTFDDGPGPYSAYAVRVLRRARARATFFLVGKELAYRPQIPRLEESVAALGDHTWSHHPLVLLSQAALATELASAKRAISGLAREPIQMFRPPYGETDAAVLREAEALGMVEVLWSVDSGDSRPGADAAKVARRVKRLVRPGSIVLMHENRGQTMKALRSQILPFLRRDRLRAVSVPALLATDPPSLSRQRAGLAGCLS